MNLATRAGIRAAPARVELIQGTAVAVIRRFDRAYRATITLTGRVASREKVTLLPH